MKDYTRIIFCLSCHKMPFCCSFTTFPSHSPISFWHMSKPPREVICGRSKWQKKGMYGVWMVAKRRVEKKGILEGVTLQKKRTAPWDISDSPAGPMLWISTTRWAPEGSSAQPDLRAEECGFKIVIWVMKRLWDSFTDSDILTRMDLEGCNSTVESTPFHSFEFLC